jgi:hypothetical protein
LRGAWKILEQAAYHLREPRLEEAVKAVEQLLQPHSLLSTTDAMASVWFKPDAHGYDGTNEQQEGGK